MKSQAKKTPSTKTARQPKAAAKTAAKAKAKKPAPASKNVVGINPEAIRMIPLTSLRLSDANVRKVGGNEIADLLASMKGRVEQGRAPLLQNLVVREGGQGGFEVTGGGRRWRALFKLAGEGVIAADFPVPCLVVDADAALEDSASENLARKDMHPADEFQAFADLIEQGRTPAQIASRFNLKPEQVRRRLTLAKVSPKLIERFRRDELELDQVMALTLTDDHALQEQIIGTSKRTPAAYEIKRRLSDGTVSSRDKRVTFVGLKAYEKAGGQRVTDLFAGRAESLDECSTEFFLADEGLIERLALEKLQAHGEAWAKHNGPVAWIEARMEFEQWNSREFGKVPTVKRDDTAEEAANREAWAGELAKAEERLRQIEESQDEDDALDAEYSTLEERREELDDLISSLNDSQQQPHPELAQLAGVVVSLDYNGKPKLHSGLVRAEDKREASKVVAEQGIQGDDEGGGGGVGDQAEPMGLMRELTSVRSVVLQHSLANDTGFALRLLAFQLATRIAERHCFAQSGVHITLTDERTFQPGFVATIAGTRVTDELAAKAEQWAERLGADEETVWTWCMRADDAAVLDLLAYCTASAYCDVRERDDSDGRSRAVVLLDKMDVKVSDHWKPTADNYFGKLKKAPLLALLGQHAPEGAAKMKRAALAKVAEETLGASGWMPPVMG